MTKMEQLTNEINEHLTAIIKLKLERQKICKHKNIKEDSYCDDNYAIYKTYTTTYKCKDCGLYSTSNIDDDNFKKLNELYKKSLWKEL